MPNPTHTPGPWNAHKGVIPDQPHVWDVTSKHGWGGNCNATPEGWFVATIHEVTNADSAAANARLIAAAPELLAICKRLLDRGYVSKHCHDEHDDHMQLVAAIRKAEASQ